MSGGGGGGGGAGGAGGGGRGKNKKDVLHDMERLMDQPVNVKLAGGREVTGVLKGYDASLNLVLDETREYVRDYKNFQKRRIVPDPEDDEACIEDTRNLGVAVVKGTLVEVVAPYDGTEEIPNPFMEEQEE